jgi:hypothetical protein
MIVPLPATQQLTEVDIEKMQWHDYIWNSHKWIETHKGYYTCAFCRANWTSKMSIDENVRMCANNPYIRQSYF